MSRFGFKAKQMAMSAIFVALMVILVYLSSFFPVMSLSIIAIAGVLSAIIVSEFGISAGAIAYVAASVLSFILVPDKSNAVLFILLFGCYPIVKIAAERVKRIWFTWLIKLVVANVLFIVVCFLFKTFFFTIEDSVAGFLPIVCIVFNVVFVMYDVCLKKLVIFYKIRIAKWIQ